MCPCVVVGADQRASQPAPASWEDAASPPVLISIAASAYWPASPGLQWCNSWCEILPTAKCQYVQSPPSPAASSQLRITLALHALPAVGGLGHHRRLLHVLHLNTRAQEQASSQEQRYHITLLAGRELSLLMATKILYPENMAYNHRLTLLTGIIFA